MWYVYNKDSTVIQKICSSHKTASAWRTRKHNQFLRTTNSDIVGQGPLFNWGCADAEFFHTFIEKTIRKTNLMTGEMFSQSVNTPRSCDPSSELFWSM